MIRRREKRRKKFVILCMVLAVGCFAYFAFYSYMGARTESIAGQMAVFKDKVQAQKGAPEESFAVQSSDEARPAVLPEYQDMANQNKSLIGWVKVADTNIDYPVVQAKDNTYYLTHSVDQKYDKNGSIFLDSTCDVLNRPTNLIIYGHHMKSGNMFGQLDAYADESFYESHPTFQFDTIYEKGTYQVAYVFRSQVYREDEITFKYYQFFNANSKAEFDSDMLAMAKMGLYDTGITPEYGDQLVTLSTCDHSQEKNGRFVVVGVKIS